MPKHKTLAKANWSEKGQTESSPYVSLSRSVRSVMDFSSSKHEYTGARITHPGDTIRVKCRMRPIARFAKAFVTNGTWCLSCKAPLSHVCVCVHATFEEEKGDKVLGRVNLSEPLAESLLMGFYDLSDLWSFWFKYEIIRARGVARGRGFSRKRSLTPGGPKHVCAQITLVWYNDSFLFARCALLFFSFSIAYLLFMNATTIEGAVYTIFIATEGTSSWSQFLNVVLGF